jgi:integrase
MPVKRSKSILVSPVSPGDTLLNEQGIIRREPRKVRFTDALLRSLKPGPARYEISDTVTRGLSLRVSPSGEKVFSAFYRRGVDQKFRRFTIGVFGDAEDEKSLKQARDDAEMARAKAKLGQDAQDEKLEARFAGRTVLDFASLAERFIADRAPNLAPSTATEYRRQVKAYLRDARIAKMPAREVRRSDLRETLEAVARDNGPVMSNRYFQFLRAVSRWGLREDLLDLNPADGIQRPRKETSRERILSDPEVAILWRSLDRHQLNDGIDVAAVRPEVATAVRTLLLGGQRSTETVEMRWSDLDLDASPVTWTIPSQFRKGGRLHVVPLSPAVVRLLKALPRGEVRVFSEVYEGNAERDWWGGVRERCAALAKARGVVMERFTKHDLRRTCATGCAKLGASDFTVSRILGHAVLPGVQVSRVYNRYEGLPEMAAALRAWAGHVASITRSKKRRAGSAYSPPRT